MTNTNKDTCARCSVRFDPARKYSLIIYGNASCDECWQAFHDRCSEEEDFVEAERGSLGADVYAALAAVFFGVAK